MSDTNSAKSERAMTAMRRMKKIDIGDLEKAVAAKPAGIVRTLTRCGQRLIVPARSLSAATQARRMAAARLMPEVRAVFGSSAVAGMIFTP